MTDLHVLSIRRLIDDVVLYGRRHWRQILPSVALAQFFLGLVALLVQDEQLALADSPNPSPDELLGVFGLLIPLLIGVFAIYLLAFCAVMVACIDGLEERPIDMARAWKFALRPKVFLTNGVVLFATSLAFMCCIVPGFIVGPLLTLCLPVMVYQQIYGFRAMGESIELAKYNPTGRWRDSAFLHILGVLVAGGLINYAVTFLVQLPLFIVQAFTVMRGVSSGDLSGSQVPPLWLQVPTQGLIALVTTATWIYWCFGIAALYREILRRQRGEDLQEAIDQLVNPHGTPATPANPSAAPNPYAAPAYAAPAAKPDPGLPPTYAAPAAKPDPGVPPAAPNPEAAGSPPPLPSDGRLGGGDSGRQDGADEPPAFQPHDGDSGPGRE